jgi:ATP-dependent DNA helicase RecG
MAHTADEIRALLPRLDTQIAEELESETLDFKECPSEDKLRELARRMAVCLGNASGGTVVFGVKERVRGREKAVVGIDFAPDLQTLKTHLYDSIDPKLVTEFEWLFDGAQRLLLMHVYASMPPYTTTGGEGWIRIGKDCKPLTGSLLHDLRERSGLADPTRRLLSVRDPLAALSPEALEILRRELRAAGAASDLLSQSDADLCTKLGIIREGQLTMGGLLLAGRDDVIAEHTPVHEWKYVRLKSDTDYEVMPIGGQDSILVALDRIMLVLGQQNPVTTVPSGFYHGEFPQYPVIALREAILNAFAHRDYTMPSMVFIRHYRDRLEINSPGGFVGGVTPANILHHEPVTRNRYLVETILVAARLVNRANLGVSRMFRALLEEGKEPPAFQQIGQTVQVVFPGRQLDPGFRVLIGFLENSHQRTLDVDELLLLHLLRRGPLPWRDMREAYPSDEHRLREKLAGLQADLAVVQHTGSGTAAVYRLSRQTMAILNAATSDTAVRDLERADLELRVLNALEQGALSNQELRRITGMSRQQVTFLLSQLQRAGQVRLEGRGNTARWHRVQDEIDESIDGVRQRAGQTRAKSWSMTAFLSSPLWHDTGVARAE